MRYLSECAALLGIVIILTDLAHSQSFEQLNREQGRENLREFGYRRGPGAIPNGDSGNSGGNILDSFFRNNPIADVITDDIAENFDFNGGNLGIAAKPDTSYNTFLKKTVTCKTVVEIDPFKSAYRNGLRVDDRLCAVNDYWFESANAMESFVSSRSPGSSVLIAYYRPSTNKILKSVVTLNSLEENIPPLRTLKENISETLNASDGTLGVGFDTADVFVSPNNAQGNKYKVFGAKIVKIFPGSAADIAGMEVGNILLSIDGIYAENGTTFYRLMRSRKAGSRVSVEYMIPGQTKIFQKYFIITAYASLSR